jgi:hypothetical protein
MNHARIVEQERRPRCAQRKAHAIWPVRFEHPRFATAHIAPLHENYRYEIHAIAVRALRRRPAHAFGGINAKLVGFDKPLRHGFAFAKHVAYLPDQRIPRRACIHLRRYRLKPALDTAMQRVVIGGLPMRAVFHQLKLAACAVLNIRTVAAGAVFAAIAQVGIAWEVVPAGLQNA